MGSAGDHKTPNGETKLTAISRSHLKSASLDELEGEDGCALLHQAVAVGGHGARRDASHVCMVPPRRHKEHYLALAEDGCDDCDVRQVRSSGKLRVVGRQHISRLQTLVLALPLGAPVLDLRRCMFRR